MWAYARTGSRWHRGFVKDVCALEIFSEDADILVALAISLRRLALKRHWNVRGVLFGGYYIAEDASIVSQSPRELKWMMVIFVEVFGALTIS